MKWLFWISAVLIFYAYAGYPLVLWVMSKLRRRPVAKLPIEPTVSIVMSVRNEATRLKMKLRNLGELDYPKQQLEIIVVSDGSTDGTNEALASCDSVRSVIATENCGKAKALNSALAVASGEIVVFTDVRQEIEPQALRELVANFADPAVGCVSGELMFRRAGVDQGETGVSAYWRFEKLVRKLEASTGSVVGATGALYAARRAMVAELPEGTLLDDVYIPLGVARQRGRVIFEGNARAWDDEPAAPEMEFRRKVRTLAGNYQLLQLAPWLLTGANPLRFRFVSHKLLRLIVPFLLIIVFACSVALSRNSFYLALAVGQVVFYALALAGVRGWRVSLASAAAGFCVLNAAAAAALLQFWRYRHNPVLLWKVGYPSGSDAGRAAASASKLQAAEAEPATAGTLGGMGKASSRQV